MKDVHILHIVHRFTSFTSFTALSFKCTQYSNVLYKMYKLITHPCTYTCTYVDYIYICTSSVQGNRIWVTKKYPFFVNNNRATEILHSVSVPFRSTYYSVYFCCMGKIILSTWNGEQTVKKTVKRTLYVCKAGARKLLISKELPISKNGDGV